MSDDLTRLASDLERAAKIAPRRVGAVLGRGADAIRDDARANVSRNMSPRFADAIVSRREASGDPAGYVLLQGIPSQDDAPAAINSWEVGTARHEARPSIAPAVEKNVGRIADEVAAALDFL